MKKLLSIIVVSLLWCNISLAQEFYPNKELDIDELINFDLTKYKFTDYKKIIGSKVKSWEGNTQQLSRNVKNWKTIDVKINNKPYELRLNHLDTGGINLFILIRGVSCEEAKSIFPAKYIREENSIKYTSDFGMAGKLYQEGFSFDTNKNTRLKFGCIAMLDSSNQGSVDDVSATVNLYPQNEGDYPQTVPLKMIRCKIVKSKTKYKVDLTKVKTLNNSYTTLTDPQIYDHYISDGESLLMDKNFIKSGKKVLKFDKDLIHTETRRELDKTKTKRLEFFIEYKIDRIYGDISIKKIIYDEKYVHAGAPNNELEIEFKGNCVKKDIKERAF